MSFVRGESRPYACSKCSRVVAYQFGRLLEHQNGGHRVTFDREGRPDP